MKFTLPFELGDRVIVRATQKECEIRGIKYENGSIGDTFFMDCFSIYTSEGMFALQELAPVPRKLGKDDYLDEHSV